MADLKRILGAMGGKPKKTKSPANDKTSVKASVKGKMDNESTDTHPVVLVWDEGESLVVFLIDADVRTKKRLMAINGKYINHTQLAEDAPIFALSDKIQEGKLDKYLVDLPLNIDTPSTLVMAGWAP